jgi:DNA-directed RNA polymerase delta subunit
MPAIRGKGPWNLRSWQQSDVTGEINSTQTSNRDLTEIKSTQTSNQAWTSITRSPESKKEIKKK